MRPGVSRRSVDIYDAIRSSHRPVLIGDDFGTCARLMVPSCVGCRELARVSIDEALDRFRPRE